MADQSEQDRLRSYLAAQSAKLSAREIRSRLEEAAQEFLTLVADLPERGARTAPAPGEWSVAEVVDHVTVTLEEVGGLMRDLAAGRRPPRGITVNAKPVNAGRPLAGLVAALRQAQAAVFAFLDAQADESHLEVRVAEPFFGDVNWKAYGLILRLHYNDHAEQVRRALAASA